MPDREEKTETWLQKYYDLVVAAALVPFLWVFVAHNAYARGMTAGFSAYVLIMAAVQNWSLKGRLWFWLLLGFLAAAHAAIAIYRPWYRDDFTFINSLPIALCDYLICLGLIALGKRLFERPIAA